MPARAIPTGKASTLSPLATDPPSQLNVLGHDGHALGMDGAQVGVLEETHQVGLCSLLKGQHCMALEAEVSLHRQNRVVLLVYLIHHTIRVEITGA